MFVSLKKLSKVTALVATLVLVVSSFSPAFAQVGTCDADYTTVAGDTLQSVATACGVTVDQVFTADMNQNLTLTAGQTLNIPQSTGNTDTSGNTGTTAGGTDTSGDTGSTAGGTDNSGSTTGTTTGGTDNSGTTAGGTDTTGGQTGSGSGNDQGTAGNQGQVPVTGQNNAAAQALPAAPALGANQHYIVVFPGDTLSRFAFRYNTTIDNLLSLNPQIENRAFIRDGQVIVVPNADANANQGVNNNDANSGTTGGTDTSGNTGTTGGTDTTGGTGTDTTAGGTDNSGSTTSGGTTSGGTTDTTAGGTDASGSTTGTDATGSTAGQAQTYVTVAGDTLQTVATQFNVRVEDLALANPDATLDADQVVTFTSTGSTGGTDTTGTTGGTDNSGTTGGTDTSGSTTGTTTGGTDTTGTDNQGTGSNNGQVPVTGSLNFTGNAYYDAYFNQFNSLNEASAFNYVPGQGASTFSSNYYVKPDVADNRAYKVQAGESLLSIANKYGTTVEVLRDLNRDRLSWNGVVFTGQYLVLP